MKKKFKIYYGGWTGSLLPSPEGMLHSKFADEVEVTNITSMAYPALDALIEKLISAKTREELTTAIHALDRVLLWGHYVIPLYHSNTDRIAYWNFLEYPEEIPLYGIVIESWWINKEKAQKVNGRPCLACFFILLRAPGHVD